MKFLLAVIIALVAPCVFADSFVFDSLKKAELLRGGERKQSQEMARAADGESARLKLVWEKERFRYAEFRIAVNSLPPVANGVAELRVFLPEGSLVSRVGLRLADRKGEVFQFFPLNPTVKPGEWTTLLYRLTEKDAAGSWGGNNDKKIDGDLRLVGLAVNFHPRSETGSLIFGDLKLTASGGDLLESREAYLKFDWSELYTLRTVNGSAALKPEENSLTVSGRADSKCKLVLTERKHALTPLTPARKFALHLADVKGSGEILLRFRDSQGNLQQSRQSFTPESRTLTFTFPKSEAPSGQMLSWEILPKAGEFQLRLTGAERFVDRTPAETIAFDVETGNLLHILPEGEEEKFALMFQNRSPEALTARAVVEFRDYYGRVFTETFDLKLASGAVERRKLTQPLPHKGIWYVSCRMTTSGTYEDVALTKRSFAWMKRSGPTPGRAQGFLFGVCSHPQRWSDQDQELEALALAWCGAKVLRNDTGWNNIQPAPDRWNFSSMDRKLELFGRYNIELAPIWAYTAQWAASPEARAKGHKFWFRSLPDYDAWENFVKTITARYRGKIRYWEIWNEPDFSGSKFNSDEYVEMMKRAYRAAKAADPDVIVQSGGAGTLNDHPSKKGNFHEETLIKGKGYFDIHATHEHGRFASYEAVLESRFFPVRKRTGTTVPWYPNETAISSLGGNERLQAETLFKKLIYSWGRGAIGYNWYNLRNDGFDARNGEHNYGMVTNDFYPKAVYVVFNTLTGVYSKARFERQLDLGDRGLWGFLFARENELLVGHWNETLRGATVPILLKTDAKSAETVDLMGNRKALAISDGVVLLEVGDAATLRLIGGTKCEVVGTLLDVEPPPPALAGASLPLNIRIRNAFPDDREIAIRLSPPAGITADPVSGTVKTATSGETLWRTRLNVSADFTPPPELSQELLIAYTVSPGGIGGEVRLPIVAARKIPVGAMRADAPDFRLNRQEQAISLFAADPGKVHLTWQGPEDRSALVWLRLAGDKLLIRFDVTDDKHVQPHSGVAVWRGDNVQMGILLPDQNMPWEIGLTRLDSGKSEVHLWSAPAGIDRTEAAATVKLETARTGTLTRYQAEIPLSTLGVTAADLARGIRFNALVNDDDGEGREGWIQIAPGIGENKDPSKYPMLVF